MARVATWENVGTEFIPGVTEVHDGLPAAMDFTVHKEPIGYMNHGNFVAFEDKCTVINDNTGFGYGPVSNSYAAVSNRDALGVLQDVERMGMTIKRYGDTYTGMQFVIGELPSVNILGDAFTPYLCFRNSFNGRYPIQVCICPLRIVCQNQLTWAFENSENTINIRHTAKAVERLAEAQRIMLSTADYMQQLNQEAEKYANIHINAQQKAQILADLFPITNDMSDTQKHHVLEKSIQFQAAMLQNDLHNFRGTAWELVQAYADYASHLERKNTKHAAETSFMSITFDPSVMQRMISAINKVAA